MLTILNICWNVINRRKLIDEEATIDVTLQPLPFQTSINMFPPCNHTFGASLASSIAIVMSFLWPAFVVYLISERGSFMRKQQFLAGARVCSYWMFMFLYDIVFLLIYSVSIVAVLAIYMDPYHDTELYGKFALFLHWFLKFL